VGEGLEQARGQAALAGTRLADDSGRKRYGGGGEGAARNAVGREERGPVAGAAPGERRDPGEAGVAGYPDKVG
jgi:hypothetical protein